MSAADGMAVVGITVLAYQVGGTPTVALLVIIRNLPSVVTVPALLSLTNGIPRDRLLRLVVWAQVVCLVLLTALLIGRSGLALVFLLTALEAVAGALLRPLRSTLMPALARTPEELVAGNVVATTGDALAAMLGPGGAAILLVIGDVTGTVLAGAIVMALALAAVIGIHAAPDISRPRTAVGATAPMAVERASVLRSMRELLGMPYARLIVLLFFGQRFVRGVIVVAFVAAAFELLRIGDSGVGILTSAVGFGGLLGGGVALGLVGRQRLAPAFAAGLIAWGVGILAAGVVPSVVVVVVFLAVAGIGKTALDTAGYTLLQRTVPNDQRSNVFGLLESVISAAIAIGPIAAAGLIGAVGPGWTLVVAGALPLVLVLLTWPVLRSADDAAVVPQPALQLLSGAPMFRPLQLTTLETLAGRMVEREFPAGTDVIRQGELGDTFYIVVSGRLTTLIDGAPVGELGPRDSFGEIALLRATERTATVRALEDSRLVELACEPFLAAVSSTGDSAAAADAVVRARLAGT